MKGDVPERRLYNSSHQQLKPPPWRAAWPSALSISSLLSYHISGSVPVAGSTSTLPTIVGVMALKVPASQEGGAGPPDVGRECTEAG